MQNFTEEQKEELAELAEQDFVSYFLAYDPNNVDGDPEQDALDQGYVEFYREETANLIEIIYTRNP